MPQDCPICKAVSSLSPVSTHILILARERLFKVSWTPYNQSNAYILELVFDRNNWVKYKSALEFLFNR